MRDSVDTAWSVRDYREESDLSLLSGTCITHIYMLLACSHQQIKRRSRSVGAQPQRRLWVCDPFLVRLFPNFAPSHLSCEGIIDLVRMQPVYLPITLLTAVMHSLLLLCKSEAVRLIIYKDVVDACAM